MLPRAWRFIRPAVFWRYPRGSWQYDIMVGLILVFVLATPREWFRDQPRIARPQQIVMLPSETGRPVFWIDPELIGDIPPGMLGVRLRVLLRQRTGSAVEVLSVEPAKDHEGNLKGYLVRGKL